MTRAHPTPASLAHRLTALLGLALVVALNLLAARPDWHAALHDEAGESSHRHARCPHHGHGPAKTEPAPVSSDDHVCVISAFAHGQAAFDAASLAVPPVTLTEIATLAATIAAAPIAPEFFLPPGCGPPAV